MASKKSSILSILSIILLGPCRIRHSRFCVRHMPKWEYIKKTHEKGKLRNGTQIVIGTELGENYDVIW
jgi:hypothetical protein